MRHCSLCKNEKEGDYCVFCCKKTKNHYILKATVGKFNVRFPLVKMSHKRLGFKRFLSRVYVGWQETKGGEKSQHPDGVNKYMKIDKENNKYRELITDCRTGKILKDKDEPLQYHVPENQTKK